MTGSNVLGRRQPSLRRDALALRLLEQLPEILGKINQNKLRSAGAILLAMAVQAQSLSHQVLLPLSMRRGSLAMAVQSQCLILQIR